MSTTFGGSTLAISSELPVDKDRAGYEALDFKSGVCALRGVPRLERAWEKLSDRLSGAGTNSDLKGDASWEPVTFRLTKHLNDEAQLIYEALEASPTAMGSFRVRLSNGGTTYFVARVSMFSFIGGGDKNTINSGGVELLIQGEILSFLDENYMPTDTGVTIPDQDNGVDIDVNPDPSTFTFSTDRAYG